MRKSGNRKSEQKVAKSGKSGSREVGTVDVTFSRLPVFTFFRFPGLMYI